MTYQWNCDKRLLFRGITPDRWLCLVILFDRIEMFWRKALRGWTVRNVNNRLARSKAGKGQLHWPAPPAVIAAMGMSTLSSQGDLSPWAQ
jgi:hypothetical protein